MMPDVIIAIVPAPGHEGLVATWMPQGFRGTVERPARVIRCSCGAWACSVMADGHMLTHDDALVLFAPGSPRLGMVRAMDVMDLAYVVTGKTREGSRIVVIGWRNGGAEEVNEVPEKWPDGMPKAADEAFAAAHLLHQWGHASEVLVLPVSP